MSVFFVSVCLPSPKDSKMRFPSSLSLPQMSERPSREDIVTWRERPHEFSFLSVSLPLQFEQTCWAWRECGMTRFCCFLFSRGYVFVWEGESAAGERKTGRRRQEKCVCMCLRCVRASVLLSLFSLSLSLSSPPSLSLPFYSCLLPFYIPFLYELCCLYLCPCLFVCLCLCHFSCRCLSLSLVVSLSLSVTRRVFVYTYTKSHTHAQYHTQMIEHARDSEERLGADRSKHITPLLGCFHHLSKS